MRFSVLLLAASAQAARIYESEHHYPTGEYGNDTMPNISSVIYVDQSNGMVYNATVFDLNGMEMLADNVKFNLFEAVDSDKNSTSGDSSDSNDSPSGSGDSEDSNDRSFMMNVAEGHYDNAEDGEPPFITNNKIHVAHVECDIPGACGFDSSSGSGSGSGSESPSGSGSGSES